MDRDNYIKKITEKLSVAVDKSRLNTAGKVADYIPELATVKRDYVASCIILADGGIITAGDPPEHKFTVQSLGKLVPLIGLIEEHGKDKIFDWIKVEPSSFSFSSISQLSRFGPLPSNPMVNAGAIALCSHIAGKQLEKFQWLDKWFAKLFGAPLKPNASVYHSELSTADRNRALAYLMKSNNVLGYEVEEVLQTYIRSCSYELNIKQAAHLGMLLANGGLTPDGNRIFSEETSNCVVAIMATCGLYNESGIHLVQTGMPAKSGISGIILSVATGRGGVAAFSPLLNDKGGSVRGHEILNDISRELNWHFAAPWGYARLDTPHPIK